MKLVDALARLQKPGIPVLETRDAAAMLDIGSAHASKILARLLSVILHGEKISKPIEYIYSTVE